MSIQAINVRNHENVAFTGASQAGAGWFEAANAASAQLAAAA